MRPVVQLALAMTAILAPAAGASPKVMTWNVAGAQRSAIVYAPASAANAKTPLVFAFHGFGDTNENFQGVGLEKAWPQAIVVYPQGLPVSRSGSALPGWQTEKGGEKDRDLQLVDTALASLREKYKVDDARIYATGFSNGAIFTYLLWAERPNVFAAFAAVAGRLGESVLPSVPKPFLQVGGKSDGNIPSRSRSRRWKRHAASMAFRRVNPAARIARCTRPLMGRR